ncbi:MAG: hypothetical protein J6I66_02135 [Lachnospiraceae bacterium]|nr:hypothetical protein [Lachnospiraceae bacterium]
MSKPSSGHFHGTTGSVLSQLSISRDAMYNAPENNGIIEKNKKKDIDRREHPTKYRQLSSKKLKQFRDKVDNRTITKKEYKRLDWQKRLTLRRNQAIKNFWKDERKRLKKGLPTTRNWSAEQRKAILSGKRPKYNGKTMASHHTYSVSKYPHLSNRKELIYPVTFHEHIYGWHGGNSRNSLPGVPIKYIKDF